MIQGLVSACPIPGRRWGDNRAERWQRFTGQGRADTAATTTAATAATAAQPGLC